MKSISLRMIPASLVFVPFFLGCGAEPITGETPLNPVVAVRSDIDAKAYRKDEDGFQSSSVIGASVDSLEVTGASVIMSDLKLHGVDNNSIEQVGTLRKGQFVLVFNPAWASYVSDVEVIAGTYAQARFDVHPRQGDLDSLVSIDQQYNEFVTFGPMSSVIIHGHTYKNGVKLPFVFTTPLVVDGKYVFSPQLSLEEGMRHELRVRFITQTAFGADGAVLDPADIRNRATIENNLRSSITIFRL